MDLSIPITGMRDAQRRMDKAAHRIAHVNTIDFPNVGGSTEATTPIGRVDLNEEIVATKLSQHAFLANANVFRAQDQLIQQGIDILRHGER